MYIFAPRPQLLLALLLPLYLCPRACRRALPATLHPSARQAPHCPAGGPAAAQLR